MALVSGIFFKGDKVKGKRKRGDLYMYEKLIFKRKIRKERFVPK